MTGGFQSWSGWGQSVDNLFLRGLFALTMSRCGPGRIGFGSCLSFDKAAAKISLKSLGFCVPGGRFFTLS
jgi:hypothetical protein